MSSFYDKHNADVEKVRADAIETTYRPLSFDLFCISCQSRTALWHHFTTTERGALNYVKRKRVKYPLYWAIARNGVLVAEGNPVTRLQE